jgi:hypothetical protein
VSESAQVSSLESLIQLLQRQPDQGAPRIVLADGTNFQINEGLQSELSNLISIKEDKPQGGESGDN